MSSRRFLSAFMMLALLGACSTSNREPSEALGVATPVASPQPSPEPATSVAGKTVAGSIPDTVAQRLITLNRNFNDALSEWLAGSQLRGTPLWDEMEKTGLRKQKVMRRLARYPNLAAKVVPQLPAGLRQETKTNVEAARRLSVLVFPMKRSKALKLNTSYADFSVKLMNFYREAQRRFDVPWHVLASVNFVESKFGRFQGPSSAGAKGPMQFMPATWDAYGAGGDVWDPHDAIMGAARYLSASGAPERMRDALFAYNHSDAYVDAIQLYAREMERDRRRFHSYYFWQVFVRTTEGDLQLTGPGAP